MMKYIADLAVPIIIVTIIGMGIIEKKNILELFAKGVLEGLQIIVKIFPYILAIIIGVTLLRETKAIDLIIYPIKPWLAKVGVPPDIVTLAFLRPISGGASMSIVMDIFKKFGPDSVEGKIASILMGGTETTFYTITILFGAINIKNIRGTLIAGLLADITAIILSIVIVINGFI